MSALSPLRVGRITGSRVAAVLGLNPYSKPDDVMRDMVREFYGAPREFTGNVMTQWGTDHEPEALARYSEQTGVFVEDAGFIVHLEYSWLGASPDGFVGEDGMVEAKCPYRGTYTDWRQKPQYEAQMRLQMACAERAWCDFVVLDRAGELHVSRLEHDPAWLPSVMPDLVAFFAEYQLAIADRDIAARHLTEKDRDDEDWAMAAINYRAACDACDAADAAKDAARAALLALAGESSAKGAGVTVTRSERAGSIAYARAVKDLLPEADLSAYAGKPSVVFTITNDK